MRFGKVVREAEVECFKPDNKGIFGVLISEKSEVWDWDDPFAFEPETVFINTYCYYDAAREKLYHISYDNELSDEAISELTGHTFDSPNPSEIRVYVFATAGADLRWEGEIVQNEVEIKLDGLDMYEIFRGDGLRENTLTVGAYGKEFDVISVSEYNYLLDETVVEVITGEVRDNAQS